MERKITCPCKLAKLPLGDPRREEILDCPKIGGVEVHPCIVPVMTTESSEPDEREAIVQQGRERHSMRASVNYFGLSHPVVLG